MPNLADLYPQNLKTQHNQVDFIKLQPEAANKSPVPVHNPRHLHRQEAQYLECAATGTHQSALPDTFLADG